MFGAIEAGGTKFVCAVSDEQLKIIEKITIPTSTPEETFAQVFSFFDEYDLEAIGIGSFGPIDVNPQSDTYGFITSTPKRKWRNVDFLGVFKNKYQIPIGWNTDVNAAALAEATFGAGKDKNSCVYITVGTGIGGGWVINGKPMTGFGHPEMGHFYPPKHPEDTFDGVCDYHGACVEGLASGPSIKARYQVSAQELPKNHQAWEIEAYYLAELALAITMINRPDCIIFGGGVMSQEHLIDMIRSEFNQLENNYLNLPPIEEYLLTTGLGEKSGIIGSLLLAKNVFDS